MWSVEYRIWNVECGVWNEECGIPNMECGMDFWLLAVHPHSVIADLPLTKGVPEGRGIKVPQSPETMVKLPMASSQ